MIIIPPWVLRPLRLWSFEPIFQVPLFNTALLQLFLFEFLLPQTFVHEILAWDHWSWIPNAKPRLFEFIWFIGQRNNIIPIQIVFLDDDINQVWIGYLQSWVPIFFELIRYLVLLVQDEWWIWGVIKHTWVVYRYCK